MNLQSNMVEQMVSPGLIDFNKYRAYRSQVREEDEPKRFVDGELIEKFLDCSPEDQERCVQGLIDDGRPVTVRDISDMVEGLKRLH
jgi:DNA damage-binding protein 1